MDKKQKIFISICVIIVIIVVCIIIYSLTNNVPQKENENQLVNIYNKMVENETYTFSLKLDDNNKYTVSRSGNMANIDTYDDGNHSTTIIRDGNTILLMYNSKKYYTYENNETGLSELSNEINEILQNQQPEKGEEQIDGKTYKYEAYKGTSYFLLNKEEFESETFLDEDVTTKFYFSGNNLKYIKTTINDKSELISVDVSYKANDDVFEIPSDFQEG